MVQELATSDGFGRFFDAHRPTLEATARRIVGDRATAEDVVATAAIRVWQRFARELPERPAAYFVRAVQNEARDHLRRVARDRALEQALRAEVPVHEDRGVEDRDAIERLLAALSPPQRATLAMRYLDDRSELDVAAALGVAPGTVKSHAHRGLTRLREIARAA